MTKDEARELFTENTMFSVNEIATLVNIATRLSEELVEALQCDDNFCVDDDSMARFMGISDALTDLCGSFPCPHCLETGIRERGATLKVVPHNH